MKKINFILIVVGVLVLNFNVAAVADDCTYQYHVKIKGHPGGDIAPTNAIKMVKDNNHAFIVDVRTRPEYVFVGHPAMAYHVPIKFWTGKHSSKGYGMIMNENFVGDLKARFNPETDTLIFMCRSGKRSCVAAGAAIKGGWPEDKIYNMLGGFEGDKIKSDYSSFNGQRRMGGWKNEGLPWTYKVESKLGYPEVN
jgi:rhodanese-related sulfurtransferase